MAELLGVIASGMSVVSLAIQIADSIKKLKTFCTSISDAPAEICLALDEVEILSLILEDIDRSAQEYVFLDPRTKLAVMKSYRLCQSSSEALKSLAEHLEAELSKGKKRGRFKIALKKDEIEILKKRIEGAKLMMLLANQCFERAVATQRWESLERDVIEIRSTMSKISTLEISCVREEQHESADKDNNDSDMEKIVWKEPTSSYPRYRERRRQLQRREGIKKFGGLLDMVMSSDGVNTDTSIRVGLPAWIYPRRYELQFMKSCQGWDQSFRSYKMGYYDDPLFHLSMAGNVAGLQRLFQSREASPFETDPDGRTPFHYAALYARPDTCQFLLDQGADPNARTSWLGQFGTLPDAYDDYPICSGMFRKEDLRGVPAYSTPINLAAPLGWSYAFRGRTSGTMQHNTNFGASVTEDFTKTMEVLVQGGCDPFHTNEYGNNVFHLMSNYLPSWQWLLEEERLQLAASPIQEILQIIVLQLRAGFDQVQGIRMLLPSGVITEELARTYTNDAFVGGQITLLHEVVAEAWLPRVDGSTRDAEEEWEPVILELLNAGADLHAVTKAGHSRSTALLHIIETGLTYTVRTAKYAAKRWVALLSKLGVELLDYGKTEVFLLKSGRSSGAFYRDLNHKSNTPNYCEFVLLKLEIGESPEDLILEFEDLYVSEPLAAGFWAWVEDLLDENELVVPGAWL